MSAESFFDTNIFIYQLEGRDDHKAVIADELIVQGIATQTACISFQVIQECINVAVCKAQNPLTKKEMDKYITDVLAPLYIVQPSIRLYQAALEIRFRYHFRCYDSLIVAAALEAGCKTLYSEDMHHGQRIEDLTITNPFKD